MRGDPARLEQRADPLRDAGCRDARVRDDERVPPAGVAHEPRQLRDPAAPEQDPVPQRDIERDVSEAHRSALPSRSLIPAASSTMRTVESSPARSPYSARARR